MLWPSRFSWAAQQLIDLEYQWAVRGDPRIADPPASPEPPQLLYLDDNATRLAPGLQECAPRSGRQCARQLADQVMVIFIRRMRAISKLLRYMAIVSLNRAWVRLTTLLWMTRYSLQHYVSALAETVAATSSEGGLASRQAVNETVMPGRPTRWANGCGGGGSGILGTIRCFFGGVTYFP